MNYENMALLNIDPNQILWLLNPPADWGYGILVVDMRNIVIQDYTASQGKLYIYYLHQYIEVDPQLITGTVDYKIVKKTDSTITYEIIENDTVSDYVYKWNGTGFSYIGKLFNDNGTLVFTAGDWKYSLTQQEAEEILNKINIQGLYDQWTQAWNTATKQIGLITSAVTKAIGGTAHRTIQIIKYAFIGLIILLILWILTNTKT